MGFCSSGPVISLQKSKREYDKCTNSWSDVKARLYSLTKVKRGK